MAARRASALSGISGISGKPQHGERPGRAGFNRFAHSAGPGISVWRLGGMGSVRSGVSHRIGLLGWIGLFGWIGVFGWLA